MTIISNGIKVIFSKPESTLLIIVIAIAIIMITRAHVKKIERQGQIPLK